MPVSRSLYEILNVSPDAEQVVIDAAYRALMKKYHPDQAAAAAEPGPSAAEINRAFQILRDPERRADYDKREWTRQQDIQLARYQPAPASGGGAAVKVFGWGGWIVALILGAVLLSMAQRMADVTAARAQAAQAAALAEPDFSSQPTLPDEELVPQAVALQIQREAFAKKRSAVAPHKAAAPKARVLLNVAPAPVRAARAARPAPRRAQARARPVRKARETEFLEREGYIY
jgi:curved DNA-binding protein CbpA